MDEQKFIEEAKKELEHFYSPYFVSEDELQNFLYGVFDYENGSLEKRQMIFQVQRFVLVNTTSKRTIKEIRGLKGPNHKWRRD